jgi:hypothetical protein
MSLAELYTTLRKGQEPLSEILWASNTNLIPEDLVLLSDMDKAIDTVCQVLLEALDVKDVKDGTIA